MPIPALPLFKHRDTVVTPADQNQFVTQFENTMDTLSNGVIPAINTAIQEIIEIGQNAINAISLDTIEDLATYTGSGLVTVKDINRGGIFVSKAEVDIDPNTGSLYAVNGGTVFAKQGSGFWVRQYSGAINVKWFGAKGDGVTDDTEVIQEAIDTAEVMHSSVWTPSGNYIITGIIVKRFVTLKGESQSSVSFLYNGIGTAITIESTKNLPVSNGSPYYGHHHSGVSVVQTGTAKTGRGIWLKHNTRGSLSNITIKGFDRGVNAVGACWINTIKNCWIVLNKYGVYLGATDSFYLEPDEIGFTSLTFSGMNASSIENNELQANDYGVYAAIYPTLPTHLGIADSLTIQDNSIEGGGQAVQFGLRQSNLRILNNYLEENGVGLVTNPVVDSVVGVDPDEIAADIVQRYAGGTTQVGLTIENNHRISTAATHPIVWIDNSGLCSIKRNTHYGNSICIKQRSLNYDTGPYILEANTGTLTLDNVSSLRVIGSVNSATYWTNNMRLGSNGNLLVGATTDNGVDKLQVNGSMSISDLNGSSSSFYRTIPFTPTLGGTWTVSPTNLNGTVRVVGKIAFVTVSFIGGQKSSSTAGWIDGLPVPVAVNTAASMVDQGIVAKGNALFSNSTRIWLTENTFGADIVNITGFYIID